METINREFLSLSDHDAATLKTAMKNYQLDTGVGYTVRNYGEGLWMLKDSGRAQGRCLFFQRQVVADKERLVAVLVYKKESQEIPARILRTAKERMRQWLNTNET